MRFIISLLLICIVEIADCQIPENLYFNHLTQSDGLSQATNYITYKDSQGFVWISSTNGLNRYDGQKVRVYKYQENDSTSLLDNYIQSIFIEDEETNVWFSTYEALVCYVRKFDHFINYQVKDKNGISRKNGYRLSFDHKRKQLGVIVEGRELFLFDIELKKWVSPPLASFFKNMHQVFPLYDEHDFLSSLISFNYDSPGLHFYSLTSKQDYYNSRFDGKTETEPTLFVKDILKLSDTLLVATNKGFVTLPLDDPSHWRFFPISEGSGSLTQVTQYKKGKILCSLNGGGLKVMDRERLYTEKQYLHNSNNSYSLSSNNTYGVWIDVDGVLWTGTPGIGVDFTQPQKIKFEEINIGKLFNINDRNISIFAIQEDRNANIWCSSRAGGGIFVLSPTLKPLVHFSKIYQDKYTLPSDDVFYIFLDDKDRCWVFSYSGFGFIEKNSKDYTFKKIKGKVFLFGIELQDKRIVFSSAAGGILLLEEEGNEFDFNRVEQFDSLSYYTHLYQNRKGWLYLNKDISSIQVVDPKNNFKAVHDKDLSIKGEVFCYYEELNSSIIWIATKNGLVRLDQKNWEWEIFTEADGLPDQQIYSVIGDDKETLWLTTNRGMVRFFPKENRFQVYSKYDGIQGYEYNTHSYLNRSNGEFWFGGTSGVNVFNPLKVENLSVKPNPTIIDIIINNVSSPDYLIDDHTGVTNISLINNLVLDYYQNDLSFRLAALEYSDPSANEYYFKIEGNGDRVVRKGKKNTFDYPNMQPGTYSLTYNASNSDGVWFDDKIKELAIIINPPWWRAWWAYLIYFIFAIGTIYGLYLYRIAQVRKEAEFKQLVAETETAVLRLQMNPHFIFNSMNSINSYILQKDVDTASDYLGQFARLMRMILNFAAKPLIGVSDEIELLTLYLQAESMRFEGRFDYSITHETDFDPDEFLIPPMILQPFVENAILHGLAGKKEKGHIDIRFWKANDSLFCSVTDNGIGRKAAQQINSKAKPHESKALSITQRRMELLVQKDGVVPGIEFIDLFDERNIASGTKVRLRFPVF